jgi:hypothetical protein
MPSGEADESDERRRRRRVRGQHLALRDGSRAEAEGPGDLRQHCRRPTRSCASCRTSWSRTSSPPTLSPSQERRYKKLKEDIVVDVKSLSLNQQRIDALVEQLYDINKR